MFSSCQDMFTPMDENTRQEDAMYTESQYAFGLLMYGYSRLPYLNTTTTDIATDDAVTNDKTSGYINMATGTWASDNNPVSQWDACKDGIQYVNKFFTLVNKVQWAPSAKSKDLMFKDRMRGESFALRAIFYYHLLMAHGGYADDGKLYGVPKLLEPEDASSDFNQERALFSDCVQQIFADCDSAMALLPLDYKDISKESEIPEKYQGDDLGTQISGYNSVFGLSSRNLISGRIAQAVKAQAAVLAASPAFRDQSGVTSAKAAELCADVISNTDSNEEFALFDPAGHLDWYASTYKTYIDGTVPEVIWRTDRSKDNNQERTLFPPSIYGNGRVNPSQNLVDAFPMNNGLPITDPNSGYDPQNPYANRDMRLSNYIIYNGSKYKTNPIYTGVNMVYGKDEFDDNLGYNETKSTRTGYYVKKLLRDDVSANPNSSTPQNHIYVRIRYTELFLAYAEAANDAFGPGGTPSNYGKSAYEVIKKIRERAGIGKDEYGRPLAGGDIYLERIKDNQELMTELIRNERRLELCFENKRFWDLRRWLMPLDETVKGMRIERVDPKDATSPLRYTVFDVEKRVYDNSYQCYGPIPKSEILKWSKLKQNKGWK